MSGLYFASVFILSVVILIDEFYFHWKRNLPRWERLGHPVDTILFLLPIGLLAFSEKTSLSEATYAYTSVLSCLCITKDEWIHAQHSGPSEIWFHSLLFTLHPVVLISGYFIWGQHLTFVRLFFFAVLAFGIYQFIFWNVYADRVFGRPQVAREQ